MKAQTLAYSMGLEVHSTDMYGLATMLVYSKRRLLWTWQMTSHFSNPNLSGGIPADRLYEIDSQATKIRVGFLGRVWIRIR